MDNLTCVPTTWRGLPATLAIGSELEVVLSLVGGHLACLRLRGEELTPLWQPPWPAAAPEGVRPAADGPYGDGPEAQLLASIVGSNLCCDRFGAPWPGERRPLHGEAGTARFTTLATEPGSIAITAHLREAGLEVQRSIRCAGPELELTTTVRHHQSTSRAIEWCEHTNLGGEFLDGCEITASVDWAVNLPGTPEPGYAHLAPEASIPLAAALAVPPASAPGNGWFSAAAVTPGADGSWSATNARLRRRLSVRFQPVDFPWLGLWTQHRGRTTSPWNGQARVRGMEALDQALPRGQAASSAQPQLPRPLHRVPGAGGRRPQQDPATALGTPLTRLAVPGHRARAISAAGPPRRACR